MSTELIFALISTVLFVIAIIPYWRDVFKGTTFPHPFSYLVWFLLTGFNSYVLFIGGEYIPLIPALLNTLSCGVLILYGIRAFHRIQINIFDYLCLILAILLLPFYYYTKDLLLTIVFSIIIDCIAFLPTFKKGWIQPWSETIVSFFIVGVSQLFTVLSLSEFTLENSIFWGYIFFANLTFFFVVALRRYYLKGWNSIFD